MSKTIQRAQTVTQVTIGVAMLTGAVVSIANMTSPVGVYSILNLFQMIAVANFNWSIHTSKYKGISDWD